MNVNKVVLLGRLGKDPENKTLPSGQTLCNLSVATSESWKDKAGNKQESTEWHKVVLFGKLAQSAEAYLKKGQQVYIEGKVTTSQWEDKAGNKRYSTEIFGQTLQWVKSSKNKAQSTQQNFNSENHDEIPF